MVDGKTKNGSVKFYAADRGFGFIEVDQGGEIFFHISDLARDSDDPIKGARVTFVRGAAQDGRPRARNVAVISQELARG